MESPEQMIRFSPSRVASASAKPDAEAPSETSSTHSGEQSDRRDVDFLTQVLSTRSEEYRLLFRLPSDEVLVQDFNCALQENILLQGHMYLFIHHICFYSNIFGFETKKTIPFHEITCVRKAKTAAIFPNAIEIFAGGKKLFFASFLSRDEAYRLIVDGWAQHSSDPKAILDRQESKSDPSSEDNGLVSERANECTQLTDDSLTSDRNKDGNISGDCKSLCNGKNNVKVSIKLLEVKENGEACNDHQSSGDLLTWQPEDVDAPKIPEYFTMVGEANFPVRVEEFFSLFMSDRAAGFLEYFHTRCGDKDFRCTPWHQHEEFGHTRDISFAHPVKIPLGAKFGHCQEVQKLHIYRNRHLVIETSQQIGNIPFGDCFKVEGIWDVEQNANEESCCTLRVYTNVAFSKRTIFKGKIEQSTKDECGEVYGLWINMAHDMLRQRNVENMEVSGSHNAESSSVVLGSSIKIEEPSQDIHTETSTMISPILSDNRNLISQMDSLVQEFIGFSTTMLSTFRYLWDTFCSNLKSQSHLPSILLLAFAATLFLMQIGIIILLIKGPKVHVVTQGNYVGTIGSYSVEDIDWLEKRFNYLKEEMQLLGTRMESMRHEYALLKVHLQSLGQLKSKS